MIPRRAFLGGVVATAVLAGSQRPAKALPASLDLRRYAYTMPARKQVGDTCTVWAAHHGVAWMMARHYGWNHALTIPVAAYFARQEARPEAARTDRLMADTAAKGYVFDQHPHTRCLPSWRPVLEQSNRQAGLKIRAALSPGHPVLVTVIAPNGNGRWDWDSIPAYGHAVLAVGYTPDGVIFKNSWGSGWGPYGNGYGFMTDAFMAEAVDGAYALSGVRAVPR